LQPKIGENFKPEFRNCPAGQGQGYDDSYADTPARRYADLSAVALARAEALAKEEALAEADTFSYRTTSARIAF
jgi:hypothetical protein